MKFHLQCFSRFQKLLWAPGVLFFHVLCVPCREQTTLGRYKSLHQASPWRAKMLHLRHTVPSSSATWACPSCECLRTAAQSQSDRLSLRHLGLACGPAWDTRRFQDFCSANPHVYALLWKPFTESLHLWEVRAPLLAFICKQNWLSRGVVQDWGERRCRTGNGRLGSRPGSSSIRLCDLGQVSDLRVVSLSLSVNEDAELQHQRLGWVLRCSGTTKVRFCTDSVLCLLG